MVAFAKSFDPASLVEELNTRQAAELLSVHPKTVRRYIEQGALIARDAAPPRSTHKDYRIPLTAVLAMRNDYCSFAPDKPAYQAQSRPRKFESSLIDVLD